MKVEMIENVQEGMQVARTIYGNNGEVLLAAGMKLTSRYIQRLKELGIEALYIKTDDIGKVEINDVISEKTRLEAVKLTQEVIKSIKFNHQLNVEKINQVVCNIIDELLTDKNLLVSFIEIRALNDHILNHSVNVAILSLITGIAMNYEYDKLKNLAIGALFHDIGKVQLPENMLHKREPLTEEEEKLWNTHPLIGFDILRKLDYLNLACAHTAFQHHEKYDGTGFPRKLKGEEIHEFARIVSICDMYDRMTTNRFGHPPLQPFQAIELLVANGGKFFDPNIVKKFLSNIAIFPVGTSVLLNNGEKGIVVQAQKEYPTRPIIRVLVNSLGNKIFPPYDINLRDNSELCIIKVLEEGESVG